MLSNFLVYGELAAQRSPLAMHKDMPSVDIETHLQTARLTPDAQHADVLKNTTIPVVNPANSTMYPTMYHCLATPPLPPHTAGRYRKATCCAVAADHEFEHRWHKLHLLMPNQTAFEQANLLCVYNCSAVNDVHAACCQLQHTSSCFSCRCLPVASRLLASLCFCRSATCCPAHCALQRARRAAHPNAPV